MGARRTSAFAGAMNWMPRQGRDGPLVVPQVRPPAVEYFSVLNSVGSCLPGEIEAPPVERSSQPARSLSKVSLLIAASVGWTAIWPLLRQNRNERSHASSTDRKNP